MLTDFQEKVYRAVRRIPKGKVATYQQIAKVVGSPKAYRAVGSCMRKNLDPKNVPCHRVVASNGSLAGYAFEKGVATKKEILLKESVVFKGDRVALHVSLWRK